MALFWYFLHLLVEQEHHKIDNNPEVQLVLVLQVFLVYLAFLAPLFDQLVRVHPLLEVLSVLAILADPWGLLYPFLAYPYLPVLPYLPLDHEILEVQAFPVNL